MPHAFDDAIVSAVLHHMNNEHNDDNLLIARAFGQPTAVGAVMTGFDGDGGEWSVTDAAGISSALCVPWPGGPISERSEVRREVVALHDAACAALGIEPRPHA